MISALEILPLTDAVLHVALGIAGTIFAMMFVGGVIKRIAYSRGHGDAAHRLSAEKTIFHAALILVILIFLWIMLLVANFLDSRAEQKVFGTFEQNSKPQREYQLEF